jgi:hypothetical protein
MVIPPRDHGCPICGKMGSSVLEYELVVAGTFKCVRDAAFRRYATNFFNRAGRKQARGK